MICVIEEYGIRRVGTEKVRNRIFGVKNHKLLFGLLLLMTIITSGISSVTQAADIRADILEASDKEKSGEYVRKRFFQQMNKPFVPTDKRKKMLIIGDSHAQDFYNAMVENNLNQRYQINTRRIPAICGIYLGSENISGLIEKKHVPICQKADTLKAAMPQIQQADVVILAANWKLWSAQRLRTTIKNLKIKAPQKLLVVGRKDFGKVNLRKYIRLSDIELRQLRNPVYAVQREINQTIKRLVPEGMFVNIQALICQSENDCPLFTPQARLISFDGGHLTQQGAIYVGSVLLKNAPLNML